MKVYIIGSLTNREGVFPVSERLRAEGHDVFDDWLSPGPEADEYWQTYERQRGRTYAQALRGTHARHIFEYDQRHLAEADAVVMVLPAGKSGHLELGWAIGQGKRSIIYLPEEPTRYDLMYLLADKVVMSLDSVVRELSGDGRTIGTPAEERHKNYPGDRDRNLPDRQRMDLSGNGWPQDRVEAWGKQYRGAIMVRGSDGWVHMGDGLCHPTLCHPATDAELRDAPVVARPLPSHRTGTSQA